MSPQQSAPELPESRLHTFIDEDRRHALYFLEGQCLIRDLALVHGIQGPGFAWFRDCVLQVQPLIALLKRDEQLGFYIDADEPLVRLKIETGHAGDTRCTYFPDPLPGRPESLTGRVRVQTLYPDGRNPYLSVIEIRALALGEIVNRVLVESYQVSSAILLSGGSDQSAMLHRLPLLASEEDAGPLDLQRRSSLLATELAPIFERALTDAAEISEALAAIGWRALASRPVRLRCPCSRERMIGNLQLVKETEGLFGPGEPSLEITCEYCKSRYEIRREELEGSEGLPH